MVIYQSNYNAYEAINNDDNTMFSKRLIALYCILRNKIAVFE